MGWLKEIEGAASHKGQVVVTRASGGSTTFVDLDTAEAACGDLKGKLRYFRGAFVEAGASRRAEAKAPSTKASASPAAEEAPTPPPEAEGKPRSRRRSSRPSDD